MGYGITSIPPKLNHATQWETLAVRYCQQQSTWYPTLRYTESVSDLNFSLKMKWLVFITSPEVFFSSVQVVFSMSSRNAFVVVFCWVCLQCIYLDSVCMFTVSEKADWLGGRDALLKQWRDINVFMQGFKICWVHFEITAGQIRL